MDKAIKSADFRKGDEVLIRTGWGTRERAYELGIDYYKRTPSIHFDAASLLAKKMDEMDSGFFMTDCGLVNPPRVQGNNWFRGESSSGSAPQALAFGRSAGTRTGSGRSPAWQPASEQLRRVD